MAKDFLSDAQYMLNNAQGNVRDNQHKQDLINEAMVAALIGIGLELRTINENSSRQSTKDAISKIFGS